MYFEAQNLDGPTVACNFSKMVEKYYKYVGNVFRPTIGASSSVVDWIPWCWLVEGELRFTYKPQWGDWIGVVVRDNRGSIVMLGTRRIVAKWDATLAEAVSASYEIEASFKFCDDSLELEGDALSFLASLN